MLFTISFTINKDILKYSYYILNLYEKNEKVDELKVQNKKDSLVL